MSTSACNGSGIMQGTTCTLEEPEGPHPEAELEVLGIGEIDKPLQFKARKQVCKIELALCLHILPAPCCCRPSQGCSLLGIPWVLSRTGCAGLGPPSCRDRPGAVLCVPGLQQTHHVKTCGLRAKADRAVRLEFFVAGCTGTSSLPCPPCKSRLSARSSPCGHWPPSGPARQSRSRCSSGTPLPLLVRAPTRAMWKSRNCSKVAGAEAALMQGPVCNRKTRFTRHNTQQPVKWLIFSTSTHHRGGHRRGRPALLHVEAHGRPAGRAGGVGVSWRWRRTCQRISIRELPAAARPGLAAATPPATAAHTAARTGQLCKPWLNVPLIRSCSARHGHHTKFS
jgi:hypothetical protein